MMPKDCSSKAPDVVCAFCDGRSAIVICGWPVCRDSWCKMAAWRFDEDGPVKIAADEQD